LRVSSERERFKVAMGERHDEPSLSFREERKEDLGVRSGGSGQLRLAHKREQIFSSENRLFRERAAFAGSG